jgi:hypothetical protein
LRHRVDFSFSGKALFFLLLARAVKLPLAKFEAWERLQWEK